MTTKTASSVIGSKSISGKRAAVPTPSGATADLTITYDTARITTLSDFMAACLAIGKQNFST